VEDEEIVAADLATHLGLLGYEVSATAARGEEAVNLARQFRPDLVLMDIHLKGPMDGVEAAEIIRRAFDLPVIYLTAHSDRATLQRAKLTEPFGYILKPFEERELESHIEMALYKHQIERKLRQSEERFRLLFNRSPDGIFVVDTTGRFVAANPACETISGYSLAELLQLTFMELCAPDLLAKTVEFFQRGVRELESLHLETALLRKDRRRVELWVTGDPFPDGGTTALHCTARDITERKRMETALRESELRYRAIGESIDYGVWVCAPDGRNIYASPSFLRLVGLTQQQCADFGWGNVLHPDDAERTIAAWKECVRTGGTWDIEHRFRGVDGQWHPILARGVPVRDEQGRIACWAGINLDISRLKQTEQALQDAQAKLKAYADDLEKTVVSRTAKLHETIGELEHFSYAIVHDMRAPLRAMQGFAGMLQEACANCESTLNREYFRRISVASNRMDQLIADSLSYSKALRQELTLEPVGLFPLLDGLVETYPNLQPDKADITIAHDLPTVLGNQAALTQCFGNLLGNAVKFAKPGIKPQIRVWAESVQSPKSKSQAQQTVQSPSEHAPPNTQLHSTPSPPDPRPSTLDPQPPNLPFVRIWVEDNGIGIPKDAQQRIFGMFQRAVTDREGTGIGLAIVRKVAQRMGGEVGVESEPDKGSRFWVELAKAP
jgi:PAS domain S-box-containing protein